MLQFNDLTKFKHFIDLNKITNVVIRPHENDFVAAFHFGCNHFVAATVDRQTVNEIKIKLTNYGSTEHAL